VFIKAAIEEENNKYYYFCYNNHGHSFADYFPGERSAKGS